MSSMNAMNSPAMNSPAQLKPGRTQHYTYTGKARDATKTPELLHPSPGNPARKSGGTSATFNILATIVGGGVLSLPYAFEASGFLLGILLLSIAAVASDFSLYLLCACSRRTATASYVQVAKEAFGQAGGYLTMALLLTLTIFVIIAYMVLLRDIWSGVVQFFLGGATFSADESNIVLVCCVVACLPASMATSLYALRYMCYVGFFSALLLTAAIGYRSFQFNEEHPEAIAQAKIFAHSWADVLHAFPIMSLAYLCHVNVLSVQAKLVNPTRDRLKGVIHGATGLGSIIYLCIGLFGYFYAYDDTKDDILLNFDPSDEVVFVGRLGLGITLLCAVPMMVLPCRDALNELMAEIVQSVKSCGNDGNGVETQPLRGDNGAADGDVAASAAKLLAHVLITLGILGLCLFAAVSLPGVAIVWSICGSSVGFLIGYTLPAVFYLRIRRAKSLNGRKVCAYCMVVASLAAIVCCTTQAVSTAMGN